MRAAPRRDQGILIVEDNPDLRSTLQELLEAAGYASVTAEDGAAALEALRRAESLPRLILLDLRMPNLDGYGFRAEQLADPALAAIPVVLCSSEPDLSQQGRLLGAVAELRKPIDVRRLLSVLDAHGGSCRR
ncbi:MAG: hypothetical protein NVSMB23_02180 [Myxococcales bacterium]